MAPLSQRQADSAVAAPRSGGRVLVVDDLEANRELLARILERQGHTVYTAGTGEEALELVARQRPDVVLLDVMMPGRSGFDICAELKRHDATRLIPVVLVTALSELDDRIHGIEAGADDFLTKPVNPHELQARVRSLLRIKRYTDELDSAEAVILSLGLTVEARDAYTQGHCARLATYGVALGQALGLDAEHLAALRRGGYLHDIGKIGVPDAILLKPGPLTDGEREVVKRHTVIGDSLCGQLRLLANVRPIVRHHHECLDGSGYPDGLRGEAVPLLAQIVSAVDLFDAVTTDRPYRRALSRPQACRDLRDEAAKGLKRADVVEAFVELVESGRLPEPGSDLP